MWLLVLWGSTRKSTSSTSVRSKIEACHVFCQQCDFPKIQKCTFSIFFCGTQVVAGRILQIGLPILSSTHPDVFLEFDRFFLNLDIGLEEPHDFVRDMLCFFEEQKLSKKWENGSKMRQNEGFWIYWKVWLLFILQFRL